MLANPEYSHRCFPEENVVSQIFLNIQVFKAGLTICQHKVQTSQRLGKRMFLQEKEHQHRAENDGFCQSEKRRKAEACLNSAAAPAALRLDGFGQDGAGLYQNKTL